MRRIGFHFHDASKRNIHVFDFIDDRGYVMLIRENLYATGDPTRFECVMYAIFEYGFILLNPATQVPSQEPRGLAATNVFSARRDPTNSAEPVTRVCDRSVSLLSRTAKSRRRRRLFSDTFAHRDTTTTTKRIRATKNQKTNRRDFHYLSRLSVDI